MYRWDDETLMFWLGISSRNETSNTSKASGRSLIRIALGDKQYLEELIGIMNDETVLRYAKHATALLLFGEKIRLFYNRLYNFYTNRL